MMGKKPATNFTVNFGYVKQDHIAYVAHLSQNNQQELFFRFLISSIGVSHYYDAINGVEEGIGSVDHFSIHKDGTTHIRYYDRSKNPKKIPDRKLSPLKELPETQFLPLFIFSFYDVEVSKGIIGRSTPLDFKGVPDVAFTWNIHNRNQFSLVCFLVGGDVNTKLMLESHFPLIFEVSDSPVLSNCFGKDINIEMASKVVYRENGLRLLVGHTKRVTPRPLMQNVVSPILAGSFDRTALSIGFTMNPSVQRINELV